VLGSHSKELGSRPKQVLTSRKKAMAAVFEAQRSFRDAWPLQRYGKLDNVFYEAVRFISPRVSKQFTARRARSIYEGTARRIDSEEMDALREAEREQARVEQNELRARLAALDEKLAAFDEVTAREEVAQARQ
jgi:hypothetical protein